MSTVLKKIYISIFFCMWPLSSLSCCITNPSVPGWCHVLCHRLASSYVILSRVSHYHPRGCDCISASGFLLVKKKELIYDMQWKYIFILKVGGGGQIKIQLLTVVLLLTQHARLQYKAESAERTTKLSTLLLRNSDAEAFEESHVPFHLQLIKLQALDCRLSVSVTLSGPSAQLTVARLWFSSSSAASDCRSSLTLMACRA